MLEKGQRLILTGEFGYFFVEGNDVLTPEQPAITDRPESLEHLLQNGEALMLELNGTFRNVSLLLSHACPYAVRFDATTI